jgi:predicted RNA-binding Zn-ribbon protein involved in translation (DUF1610 family)
MRNNRYFCNGKIAIINEPEKTCNYEITEEVKRMLRDGAIAMVCPNCGKESIFDQQFISRGK